MIKSRWGLAAAAVAMFAAGFGVRGAMTPEVVHAQTTNRVFELRTYTTPPGKLEALKTRFRDHTIRLFERHGMTNIGYWIPMDAPNSENTLIYILAHASREAAEKSWAAFRADPEWQKVAKESQKDGPLTSKRPDSVFLNPADFSKIK
ncbi:MAG: NIPSNAP family protein [Vicinamibacterales bacterium]